MTLREPWTRDTQRDLGQPYTRTRNYHLYINGQYWGLYQTQERADHNFGETYLGGDAANYDVIKAEAGPYVTVATEGNMDAYTQLYNLANSMRTAPNQTEAFRIYMQMQGLNPNGTRNTAYPVLLDVDNLIEYMQIIFFTGDRDAPISNFLGNLSPNNWFGMRDRTGETGFQFFAHDGEHTMNNGLASRIGPHPAGDPATGGGLDKSSPQWIHQMLMYSDEYRVKFGDFARQNYLDNGVFTTAKAQARYDARTNEITNAIIAESARWGDSKQATPYTKNNWLNAIATSRNWLSGRANTVISQLQSSTLFGSGALAPLYPSVSAPTFNNYGGQVPPGFSFSMLGVGTVYYTTNGSDPRLVGGGVSGTARFTPAHSRSMAASRSTLARSPAASGRR